VLSGLSAERKALAPANSTSLTALPSTATATSFVAEYGNHRIQILRYADGSHVQSIGSKGDGQGQLNEPSSVAVDGRGNVFVRDGYINGRVQVFRISDGAYVRSMCSNGSGPGQLQG
jgi:hypothetical protein